MSNQDSRIIHAFSKNEGEEIQLALRKYNGKYYIDLRLWYQTPEHPVYKPTRKGVFFPIERFSDLRKGVEQLAKVIEGGEIQMREPAQHKTGKTVQASPQ